MNPDRRSFVQIATGAALASALPTSTLLHAANRGAIKAVAFDAFPIFDPRPIAALASTLFPERGAALMEAWRVRQFEYQWLRALAGQYVDFLQATRDSLAFAAQQLKLDLSAAQADALMQAWTTLKIWPDAPAAITRLHDAGLRLAFLSNMTHDMLDAGLRAAGLRDRFEAVISTDRIRSYKPAANAYALGMQTLGLPKEEILFVAFAGWDAAGARWFGYPTYWLNRLDSPAEVLGVDADASGRDLAALTTYLLGENSEA